MSKLVKKEFTSSGSWVAPAGVTRIWVSGFGGGSGGAYGGASEAPGAGVDVQTKIADVVPNTSYTVTIGTGGAGGTSGPGSGPGLNTTLGSIVTFKGASRQYIYVSPLFGVISSDSHVAISLPFTNGTNSSSYSGGTAGTIDGAADGGGGGAGGGGGDGGDGGNGSAAGTAGNGTAAVANSGAGGGEGGYTTSGTAGDGGAGGSGYLEISWVE